VAEQAAEPARDDGPAHGGGRALYGQLAEAFGRGRIRGHRLFGVVIDAEEVELAGDEIEVARVHRQLDSERIEVALRIAFPGQRTEEHAEIAVPAPIGGEGILGGRGGRPVGERDQRDADLPVVAALAERLERQPVAEEEMVERAVGGRLILEARGVLAGQVAEDRGAPGLVERDPVPDPISQ